MKSSLVAGILAVFGLLLTSCQTTARTSDMELQGFFTLTREGNLAAMTDARSGECFDLLVTERLPRALFDAETLVERPLSVRLRRVPIKVYPPTPASIDYGDGERGISSASYVRMNGKQEFLICSGEVLYEVVDLRKGV